MRFLSSRTVQPHHHHYHKTCLDPLGMGLPLSRFTFYRMYYRFVDLYYIHNVVYSATDILYAQRSLISCSQLVSLRDPGLASIWRPILLR